MSFESTLLEIRADRAIAHELPELHRLIGSGLSTMVRASFHTCPGWNGLLASLGRRSRRRALTTRPKRRDALT
jgi:hypothetical protein